MTQTIRLQQNHSIATITLNRPDVHNAMNADLIAELTTTLNDLDNAGGTQVIILTAEGKSFCAGADLNSMQKMVNYSKEENFEDAMQLATLLKTLYECSKPTIALVQGDAYGGGLGLIACCNFAIALEDATFCFSEVKLGLIPAVISPYVIAAIGAKAAQQYFLSAERFNAKTAQQLGLLYQTTSVKDLQQAGQALADKLLKNAPGALSAVKKLVQDVNQSTLDNAFIEKTAHYIADIRVTEEAQACLKRFLKTSEKK